MLIALVILPMQIHADRIQLDLDQIENANMMVFSSESAVDSENVPCRIFEFEMAQKVSVLPAFWVNIPKSCGEEVFYQVSVNDDPETLKIRASKEGWHYVNADDMRLVSLNKGKNTIRIAGHDFIVPEVEHILLSSDSDSNFVANDAYSQYINKLESNSNPENSAATNDIPIMSDIYDFPHDYTYAIGLEAEYSFFRRYIFFIICYIAKTCCSILECMHI